MVMQQRQTVHPHHHHLPTQPPQHRCPEGRHAPARPPSTTFMTWLDDHCAFPPAANRPVGPRRTVAAAGRSERSAQHRPRHGDLADPRGARQEPTGSSSTRQPKGNPTASLEKGSKDNNGGFELPAGTGRGRGKGVDSAGVGQSSSGGSKTGQLMTKTKGQGQRLQ